MKIGGAPELSASRCRFAKSEEPPPTGGRKWVDGALRHRRVGRQAADRVPEVLSAWHRQLRGAAAVLRLSLLPGRGGQQLPRHAREAELRALGRPHATELPLRREVVLALHSPPDQPAGATARDPGAAAERARREEEPLPGQAAG